MPAVLSLFPALALGCSGEWKDPLLVLPGDYYRRLKCLGETFSHSPSLGGVCPLLSQPHPFMVPCEGAEVTTLPTGCPGRSPRSSAALGFFLGLSHLRELWGAIPGHSSKGLCAVASQTQIVTYLSLRQCFPGSSVAPSKSRADPHWPQNVLSQSICSLQN